MSTTTMTLHDVAAHLGGGAQPIYRMVKRGDLPGVKVGGSWRFRRGDIDEWTAKPKEAATKQAGDDQ